MDSPSTREWAELHAAFKEFCQAGPWQWMDDGDLLAVEEPTGGDVGYCIVMGSGGMEYGLGVFVGDHGIESYLRLIAGEVEPGAQAAAHELRSVSAMLADRKDLHKEDLSAIRSLGLRYRGRGAWPLFRSSSPGYFPWFLDAREARLLAAALRQTTAVAARILNEDLDLIHLTDQEVIFTRCYRGGVWKDEWRKPNPPRTRPEVPDFPDHTRLQRLRDSSPDRHGSWELDRFRLSEPVQEKRGEKPHYPTVVMAVERSAGLIIGSEFLGPHPTTHEQQGALVALLEKSPLIPEGILVDDEEVAQMLESVTRPLNIKLGMEPLPMLEEARESLEAYLSR